MPVISGRPVFSIADRAAVAARQPKPLPRRRAAWLAAVRAAVLDVPGEMADADAPGAA